MEDGMEELVREVSSLRSELEGFEEQVARGLAGLSRSLEEARSEFSIEAIDATSALGEQMRDQVEEAMAYLNTEMSPLQVALMLKFERVRGFRFFGAHTEQWRDDLQIAELEKRLRSTVGRPISIPSWSRNHAELDAWREMGMVGFDETSISREEFVERSERVLECASGEIASEPMECIWSA